MTMMTSQVLESLDFIETQKPRYLENETLFFLQIKKFINYTSRATLLEKIVLQQKSLLMSLNFYHASMQHHSESLVFDYI